MKYILSLALVLSLSQVEAAKNSRSTETTQSADEQVVSKTYSEASKKRDSIAKEAREAMSKSYDALSYLEKGKRKDALKALQEATGKLEILMARDKSLKLAPVSVTVETTELLSNANTVDSVKEEAKEALENDQTQKARELLAGLTSETKITVTSIPLVSYPAAMKQAASEIEAGRIDKAKATLSGAFSAVAMEEIVYPIPVAKAQYFVEEAERVASKEKPIDDEAVIVFAKAAKEELKLAEALGYGSKETFSPFYAKMDELAKEPRKKDSTFYKDLKASLADLGPSASVRRQAQEAE